MLAKGRSRWAVSQKRGSSYVFGLLAHTVHIQLIDLLFQIWIKWNIFQTLLFKKLALAFTSIDFQKLWSNLSFKTMFKR